MRFCRQVTNISQVDESLHKLHPSKFAPIHPLVFPHPEEILRSSDEEMIGPGRLAQNRLWPLHGGLLKQFTTVNLKRISPEKFNGRVYVISRSVLIEESR